MSDDAVGYRRPPKHTRFRKGQSGNPKGRTRGRRNLTSIIMDAARAPVTATIAGKLRRIDKIQATAMQLATKAAAGDAASIVRFLNWIDEIEARAASTKLKDFSFSDADLVVIREVHKRMRLCTVPDADN